MPEAINNNESGDSVRDKINESFTDLIAAEAAILTKQPLDSDLTAIAALTPSNDDLLQRKAGAWVNRSIAQVKVDFDFQEKLAVSQIFNDVEVVTISSPTTLTITDEDLNKHLFITNTDATEVEIPASIAVGFPDKGSFYVTNSENSTDNVDIVVTAITYEGATVVYPGQTVKITRITGDEWFMEEGVTRESLAINNVDNTSDANKPVSTAQAAADAAVLASANTYTDSSVTDKQIKFAVDTTLWNALPDNAAQTINTATQNKTLYISAPGAPISYTLNGGISTFPIGGTIAIFNNGAVPDISLVAGPGVTIYYNGTLTADIATKKGAMLFRVAINTWWRMS